MSNKNTLIPQAHVLTVEEASKGGQKSGEVRRARRRARDALNDLLALPVKSGTALTAEDLKSIESDANTDANTAILCRLVKESIDGNMRAIQILYTLTGDYSPRMQVEAVRDNSSDQLEEYFRRKEIPKPETEEEEPIEADLEEPNSIEEYFSRINHN